MVDKAVLKKHYEFTIKYFKDKIDEELARIEFAQENIGIILEGFKENLADEEIENAYKYIAAYQLHIQASTQVAECLKQYHNQLEKHAKEVSEACFSPTSPSRARPH